MDVVRHKAFTEPGDDCFSTLEEANGHLLRECMELNADPLSDGRIPDDTFEEERPLLMGAKPRMSCFMKRTDIRVDKYSTVTINKVHYSVPDTLVGNKLNARIYNGHVEIYDGDKLVSMHSRHYAQGEYVLDIYHYLRTLKKKPGALPQSSALLQSDATIKEIYETYISDPKGFLQVLELINDIGAEDVKLALSELSRTITHDYSADKLRLVYDRQKEESETGTSRKEDRLSAKAKSTLGQYDRLRDLQTRRAG